MVSLSKLKNENRKIEKDLEKEWADAIKTRDGWACVICGSLYSPNAHHLIPREHRAYKFLMDNGVTLCTKHHKFSRVISAHNNPMAFFMWLEKYKFNEYMMTRLRQAEILAKEGVVI